MPCCHGARQPVQRPHALRRHAVRRQLTRVTDGDAPQRTRLSEPAGGSSASSRSCANARALASTCAGTGLAPPTSAPGPGSPRPHLRRDRVGAGGAVPARGVRRGGLRAPRPRAPLPLAVGRNAPDAPRARAPARCADGWVHPPIRAGTSERLRATDGQWCALQRRRVVRCNVAVSRVATAAGSAWTRGIRRRSSSCCCRTSPSSADPPTSQASPIPKPTPRRPAWAPCLAIARRRGFLSRRPLRCKPPAARCPARVSAQARWPARQCGLVRVSVPLVRLSVPLVRLSVPLVRLSVPLVRLSVYPHVG